MRKKKKKHDKIRVLAKTRTNNIKVLISRALIDSYISRNVFGLTNNVLKEHDKMKEAIKKFKTLTVHQRF